MWDRWTGFYTTSDAEGHLSRMIPEQRLAFPWHLLIGSIIAFGVCVAGRGRRAPE